MSENRRRQIIQNHPQSGEGDLVYGAGQEQSSFYDPHESLLEKRVYLPMPIILLGFLTIIFISVTMTYLVMNWPVPGLEFAENPELARLEAAADPNILPEITFDPDQTILVNAPVADLSGQGAKGISRYAGLRQSMVSDNIGRTFTPVKTTSLKMPVVDLNPPSYLERMPDIKAATLTLDNLENWPLTRALRVDFPVVLLSLVPRNPGAVSDEAQNTTQKLMQRRYAKAVTAPAMEEGGNPLLRPATEEGPEIRTVKNRTAAVVGAPVADLDIEQRRFAGAYSQQTGAGLQTKKHDIRKTPTLSGPVVDLVVAERQVDYPGEPETRTGLERREVTLKAALGLDDPAVLLNLPERGIADHSKALDVPNQKLMQRRYAKAVTSPELMDVLPPPTQAERQPPPASIEEQDPWRRYAAALPKDIEGKGKIVIIIDDMGNNSNMARAFGKLEGSLNFAFLPYAPNLERQTQALRRQGHELLVHLPMEPRGDETPGPKALLTSQTQEELLEVIEWNLTRFSEFVGVNNHMGSRFTRDRERMQLVMNELKRRGLLFLDSRTVPNSEGARLAKSLGMPWAGRDIFLDNEIDEAAILAQLKKVERIALRRGTAIAIGHPYGATLRALRQWIPTLEEKGLVLVPLSSVVEFEGRPKLASATAE